MMYTLGLIILALGVISTTSLAITGESVKKNLWRITLMALFLAAISEGFIKIITPFTYFRGGIIYDSTSQALSFWMLTFSFLMLLTQASFGKIKSVHHKILFLSFVFFSCFAIHANRIFFTTIAVVGMLLSSAGMLFEGQELEEKTNQLLKVAKKVFLFALFLTIVGMIFIQLIGQTQVDEIQILISKQKEILGPVHLLPLLLAAIALFIGSAFPFGGLMGDARDRADWVEALFCGAVFSLVGIQVFLKYVVFMFTKVAVGGDFLEEQLSGGILGHVRILIIIAVIAAPIISFFQRRILQGLMLFVTNSFVLVLLALSFGQRALTAHAFSVIPTILIATCLLALTIKRLGIGAEERLETWVGRGRKQKFLMGCTSMALFTLAGFPPFYTGILIQKTLSVNDAAVFAVLFNILIFGAYALRLTALAFQSPVAPVAAIAEPNKIQKIFSQAMVVILIFMGIFHQSLYKYGANAIRHLFGDF